jgi:hypothetical protein
MFRFDRTIQISVVLAAVALLVAGCGSSLKESGGDQTRGDAAQEILSAFNCSCHTQQGTWLDSDHANAENIPAPTPTNDINCFPCHTGTGYVGAMAEPDPRYFVDCASCHGGRIDEHVWPFPQPTFLACGQCHNSDFPANHLPDAPLGGSIDENYRLSEHFDSPQDDSALCSRCHTDEGYFKYAEITAGLGRSELEDLLTAEPDILNGNPVQCRTCHRSHSLDLVGQAKVVSEDSFGSPVSSPAGGAERVFSASFNLCTSCHQVFLQYTWDNDSETFAYGLDPAIYGSPSVLGSDAEYHAGDLDRVIYDSHFPGTYNGTPVAGYNINAADEKACVQCHDPHGASKFDQAGIRGLTEEWGNTPGFHGDYMNWAYRQDVDCARCHSGSEYIKLTAGQDPDNLDSNQARVVACYSCHPLTALNDADTAFSLGSRWTIDEFVFPSALFTVEGLGDNALCMNCHSGRRSKADVDAAIAAGSSVLEFREINPHYRMAGATLFGNFAQGGYEFDGKAYASKFEHVASNDLCVECHNAHSGEVFITSAPAGRVSCDTCHDGVATVEDLRDIRVIGDLAPASAAVDYDGDGDVGEGIFYEMDTLKTLLGEALVAAGVEDLGRYPYFDKITTADQFRAAYNLQWVRSDPGHYAHNAAYVIELMVDSLEALGVTTNPDTSNPLHRDAEGHFNAAAEAFRHWDEDGVVQPTCSRCHASEGAAYFFDTGDLITEPEYTEYTKGISAGFACETCHVVDSFSGAFEGDLWNVADVTFPSGFVVDIGDESNLCAQCHQGRESGVSVADRIAAADTHTFINRHYLAAAAIQFGAEATAAYEYAGQSYAVYNTFPSHLPSQKTCVGCHLRGVEDHTFKPALADCSSSGCHTGITDFDHIKLTSGNVDYDGDGLASSFQDEIDGMLTLLILEIQDYAATELSEPIVYSPVNYPYFFKDTDADGVGDPDELSFGNRYSTFDDMLLAAAFNYHSGRDPCGHIHNYRYVIQTLYDSIENLGGDVSALTRP